MLTRLTTFGLVAVLLIGCSKEPPPRSVDEFIANPVVLEAAMVRCSRNRNETRYDAECVNAREAVDRLAAREEAERRAELEAQSERKREALRRTQRAAAEARRRAAEAARLREEAEYLAQFGEVPVDGVSAGDPSAVGNVPDATNAPNAPMAVIPEPADAADAADAASVVRSETPSRVTEMPLDGGGSPEVETTPDIETTPQAPAPASLDAIRDELRRRADGAGPEAGNEAGETAG